MPNGRGKYEMPNRQKSERIEKEKWTKRPMVKERKNRKGKMEETPNGQRRNEMPKRNGRNAQLQKRERIEIVEKGIWTKGKNGRNAQ